jgi:hypothetical protein
LNDTYSLSYSDGAYSTTLQTVSEGEKTYYRYETAFSIKATYALDAQTYETFQDSITSWVTFEKSSGSLQPIASHKEIITHSPTNANTVSSLQDCYSNVDYVIDVTYESDLSKGKAVVKNRASENAASEKTFEIDDEKARYLDNEQLYLAMRAVNPDAYSSPELLVYAPFTAAVQKVKATFTKGKEASSYTFLRNGTSVTEDITCNSVKLAIDSSNPGASQTLWIAQRNTLSQRRNVILKMQLPLSYNWGDLIFSLTSETFSEQ